MKWRGRQGRHSLTTGRSILFGTGTLGPLVLGWWLWSVWTDADAPAAKFFGSILLLFMLIGPLTIALVNGPDAIRMLWYDLFGTMAVTDRRVLWFSPSGDVVYRKMDGRDLIGAGFVEGDERRGWIALVQRRGRNRVREIDIRGVPEPHLALAAIHALLQEPTDPPA